MCVCGGGGGGGGGAGGGGGGQRGSDRKARRNTDAGSSPRCVKRTCLPESTFSADSLTVLVQLPCAMACSYVCARVETQIPNTGSGAVP